MRSYTLLAAALAGSQMAAAAIRQRDLPHVAETVTVWETEEVVRVRPTDAAGWLDGWAHGGSSHHQHSEGLTSSSRKHESPSRKSKHPKLPQPTQQHVKAGYTTTNKPQSHSASSSASPAHSSYIKTVIYNHNVHRRNHSAPDIAWDASLAATALKIAKKCVFRHNVREDGGGYGQNIAAGTSPADISKVITNEFYNDEVNYFAGLYGQASPTENFEHWGHFSQLVWKGSTHVGCATYHCANGLAMTGAHIPPYFTVCNYVNRGNLANHYAQNVDRPLGLASVYGS